MINALNKFITPTQKFTDSIESLQQEIIGKQIAWWQGNPFTKSTYRAQIHTFAITYLEKRIKLYESIIASGKSTVDDLNNDQKIHIRNINKSLKELYLEPAGNYLQSAYLELEITKTNDHKKNILQLKIESCRILIAYKESRLIHHHAILINSLDGTYQSVSDAEILREQLYYEPSIKAINKLIQKMEKPIAERPAIYPFKLLLHKLKAHFALCELNSFAKTSTEEAKTFESTKEEYADLVGDYTNFCQTVSINLTCVSEHILKEQKLFDKLSTVTKQFQTAKIFELDQFALSAKPVIGNDICDAIYALEDKITRLGDGLKKQYFKKKLTLYKEIYGAKTVELSEEELRWLANIERLLISLYVAEKDSYLERLTIQEDIAIANNVNIKLLLLKQELCELVVKQKAEQAAEFEVKFFNSLNGNKYNDIHDSFIAQRDEVYNEAIDTTRSLIIGLQAPTEDLLLKKLKAHFAQCKLNHFIKKESLPDYIRDQYAKLISNYATINPNTDQDFFNKISLINASFKEAKIFDFDSNIRSISAKLICKPTF